MGLDVRKPVIGGLPTTKAQTSIRIRTVSSAHLLFAYRKNVISKLAAEKIQFLASLCSWVGLFEHDLVVLTPKTGFLMRMPIYMDYTVYSALPL